ncbi:bifunctional riboflavin kinase/FAD synthetase [Cohnella algarum]|uniref:bifunctional riboflavin kinase/FAD synthetase n=1 Tax=Cohnella algarum TaxID=2044859 RepID=UPI0030841D8D
MERYDISFSTVAQAFDIPEQAAKPEGVSLAIGFFDGVHLGHSEVIKKAVSLARDRGQRSAALTFDPHPRVVLGKDQYNTILTPLDRKAARFAELGVDIVYVVSFDLGFSQVTAEQFVGSLLAPLNVSTVVVGFDFRFGHRGQGDPATLRELAGGRIDVKVVEPVYLDGAKVSSTRIRAELADGHCDRAALLLGRPYELTGTVVHGQARGRLIGFPTANLSADEPYVLPRHGVYAVRAKDGGAEYGGVMNVGIRPTVDEAGGEPKLEAHLFDFDGDLYGRELAVQFVKYIRPEKKFGSLEELSLQIKRDADEAREILAETRSLA